MNAKESETPHEKLRDALRWLSDNAPITREKINEAAMRYDLSPLDTDFLLREFIEHSG